MGFSTAVNCMDGRVQLPVNQYLRKRFATEYVDTITEPGPNLILAGLGEAAAVESIMRRLRISVEHHKSVGIAVVGHHDCAANPAPRQTQAQQTQLAVRYLRGRFPGVPVIGLWVSEAGEVSEI